MVEQAAQAAERPSASLNFGSYSYFGYVLTYVAQVLQNQNKASPFVAASGGSGYSASFMLQAHSLLWHYLWVAPNVLLLVLAAFLWKRSLYRMYPFFFLFSVIAAVEQLTIYWADLSSAIDATNWWRILLVGLVAEGLLKFAVIGEIFSLTFDEYSAIAKVGRISIRTLGVALVFGATIAAAYAPGDSGVVIVSQAHLLEQTVFLIETGLLVFIFGFSHYFKLRMPGRVFGIALGLAISACVHLGTWAFIANVGPSERTRALLDFLRMATYHVCVLIWIYCLFFRDDTSTNYTVLPPDHHHLEVWNQELERLLHS